MLSPANHGGPRPAAGLCVQYLRAVGAVGAGA